MYIPWPEDKDLINAASNYTDRIDKLKDYDEACLIEASDLKEVKPGEPLYIAGHGAVGDENIYGTKGQKLSPDALAGQFAKLNKEHAKIKMWVCFSGLGMTEKKGLAYKFWEAMHKDKFAKLTVYGYREAVLDPFERTQLHTHAATPLPGFKSLSETPDLLKILPGTAQHWRVGIDENGAIIPPKPLPRSKPTMDK